MTRDLSGVGVVQCVGECMIEIRHTAPGTASVAYSGDTYNTAVYLSRAAQGIGIEIDVRYLTGVGEDAESQLMRRQWALEAVHDDASIMPGRRPGLYLINTDDRGERSFAYWRKESAAAALFEGSDWIAKLRGDLIYLSGITLQLMSADSRRELLRALAALRTGGTVVAFDSNFRPSGWVDRIEARQAMEEVLALTDIALVTLDDEVAMGAAEDLASCAARLTDLGVRETVIKTGPDGAWVSTRDVLARVPAEPVQPIDTTAAGDSFNGGYLAARIAGMTPRDAAAAGNRVARAVVLQAGAIIPREAMPAFSPRTAQAARP